MGGRGWGGIIGAIVGVVIGLIFPVTIGWYVGLVIGYALGSMVGGLLFPPEGSHTSEMPGNFRLQTSAYGLAVPVLYGTRKMVGNLLWYGNVQTIPVTETQGGGKGGGGGSSYTYYTYQVSFIFGLCHGPAEVKQIWLNKELIEQDYHLVATTGIGPASVSAPGSGYLVGDILTVSGGTGGTFKVISVNYSEHVLDVELVTPGTGYTTGIKATTGGAGTACTIDIHALGEEKVYEGTWHDKGIYIYDGTQTTADSHVATYIETGRPPVWKGLCYVVFRNYNLGRSTYMPNFAFEVQANEKLDVLPTEASLDILTNDFYGGGISIDYINTDSFEDTALFCEANDLKISLLFSAQVSILDALQHCLMHHDGYMIHQAGEIYHKQLINTNVGGTLDSSIHMIKEEGKPQLSISKKGSRDYNNKVTIEYTNRAKDYTVGTAYVDDLSDIELNGLKDVIAKADGMTTFDRASRLSSIILLKSLTNPEFYDFKLGPEAMGMRPGELFHITDVDTETNQRLARINSVSEGDDYTLEISATEEIDTYSEFYTMGYDTSIPATTLNNSEIPDSVVRPMAIEVPSVYSGNKCLVCFTFSKNSGDSWAGASIYESFSAAGSYVKSESQPGSGVTGRISTFGTDATSGISYIDVYLDWDATLSSAVNIDDLLASPMKNLFIVETSSGDKFYRFTTATLTAERLWRLTGILSDVTGFPGLNDFAYLAGAQNFSVYTTVPYTLEIPDAAKNRSFYFKPVSFNFRGVEQDISDVDYVTEYVDALCDIPLSLAGVTVGGNAQLPVGITSTGSAKIPFGDLALTWKSCNRYNEGYTNYTQADSVIDDSDFLSFRVDVYSGATLKRSTSTTNKYWTYTSADQTTDGVNATAALTLQFYQVGAKATSLVKTVTANRV